VLCVVWVLHSLTPGIAKAPTRKANKSLGLLRCRVNLFQYSPCELDVGTNNFDVVSGLDFDYFVFVHGFTIASLYTYVNTVIILLSIYRLRFKTT
jgi:hypothetical protein